MQRTTIPVPKVPQNANELRRTAFNAYSMKPQNTTFLEADDIRRFSALSAADKLAIAKSINGGISPSYVHQILTGKLRIVSPVAQKVVAAAERKLARS